MKTSTLLAVSLGLSALAPLAQASDMCNVAEADRRPIEELQAQLESEGWDIREMKVDDGCYEAYAIKPDGTKVEAYFDPATFEVVKSEES